MTAYQVGPAEVPGGDRTFAVKANTDITKYAAVIQSSGQDNEVDMPGAAGVAGWGFAQESVDYSEGQHHVRVRTMGFSKAIAADGNIAAGARLAIADTAGKVTTAAATQYVVAKACQASAAAGDLIVVMVVPSIYVVPS